MKDSISALWRSCLSQHFSLRERGVVPTFAGLLRNIPLTRPSHFVAVPDKLGEQTQPKHFIILIFPYNKALEPPRGLFIWASPDWCSSCSMLVRTPEVSEDTGVR